MNRLVAWTMAIAMFSQCALAWDCWDQCPKNEYRLCLEGTRFLSEPVDLSRREDDANYQGEPMYLSKAEAPPTSNLRGRASSQQMDQENTYRELQTSTNFTYFQFKMYWEPGYCVSFSWARLCQYTVIAPPFTHVCALFCSGKQRKMKENGVWSARGLIAVKMITSGCKHVMKMIAKKGNSSSTNPCPRSEAVVSNPTTIKAFAGRGQELTPTS